jgi:hypothetical protein
MHLSPLLFYRLKVSTVHIFNHHARFLDIQLPVVMDVDLDMDVQGREMQFANYLPDELLLQVLDWLPMSEENQKVLANFVLVSR